MLKKQNEEKEEAVGVPIEGGVWQVQSTSAEPSVDLVRWSVVEINGGSRHFIGYNPDGMEGRVSSAVQQIISSSRCGVTRSGRTYRLLGEPGTDSDAEYVWAYWRRVNRVTEEKDVTAEIMASFQG